MCHQSNQLRCGEGEEKENDKKTKNKKTHQDSWAWNVSQLLSCSCSEGQEGKTPECIWQHLREDAGLIYGPRVILRIGSTVIRDFFFFFLTSRLGLLSDISCCFSLEPLQRRRLQLQVWVNGQGNKDGGIRTWCKQLGIEETMEKKLDAKGHELDKAMNSGWSKGTQINRVPLEMMDSGEKWFGQCIAVANVSQDCCLGWGSREFMWPAADIQTDMGFIQGGAGVT